MEINREIIEIINEAIRLRRIYESDKGSWLSLAMNCKPERVKEILSRIPVNFIDTNPVNISSLNIQPVVNYTTMPNKMQDTKNLEKITELIDQAIVDRKFSQNQRDKLISSFSKIDVWDVIDLVNYIPPNAIDGAYKLPTISSTLKEIGNRCNASVVNHIPVRFDEDEFKPMKIADIMSEISQRTKK